MPKSETRNKQEAHNTKRGEDYRSVRGFAKAVGVAASTLSGYLKRDDWPVPRKAPWSEADLAKVRSWRQWLQEDRSGKGEGAGTQGTREQGTEGEGEKNEGGSAVSPGTKAKADALLKWHRARKAKVDADAAEGRVVPREMLERALAALATIFVQVGDDTFERLPHELDGDPTVNEVALRQAWHDWRRRIIEQAVLDLARLDEEIAVAISGPRRGAGRGRRGV